MGGELLKSRIPFVAAGSGEPVLALAEARVLASSQGQGWSGLYAELGYSPSWEVRELSTAGHYLAVNLGDAPLRFERRGERGRYARVTMPVGSSWMNPAGNAFTHQVAEPALYGAVVLDPGWVERMTGVDRFAPELAYGVEDRRIEALVRALLQALGEVTPETRLRVEAMGIELAAHLVRLQARSTLGEEGSRSGRVPERLSRVLEWIAAHLGEAIRQEELARVAGLSPYHFAREFRRALGCSPHQFILEQRLGRARERLHRRQGESVAEVALTLGFADQSHLTRLFKRRYGVTPGALVRSRRG